MSFQESNNVKLPSKTWTKVSDVSTLFQIKGKWSSTIYYIETTEDLSNPLNATYIRLKNPDPILHEIGFIQTGTNSKIKDFKNYTFTANQGSLWLWSEESVVVLKGI